MTRFTEHHAVNEPDRVISYTIDDDEGEWIGSAWMVPGGFLHSGQAPGSRPCMTLRDVVKELKGVTSQ